MWLNYNQFFGIVMGLVALSSCSNIKESPDATESNPFAVQCKSPRPQICTMDYTPVCATRDNGVRCVTSPCESTETASYSNGCSACSDPSVYSYQMDACQ